MQDVNEKILNVPYFSQFKDVTHPEYQDRACSLACLNMALEYFFPDKESVSIDKLFEESEMIQQDMFHKGMVTEKALSCGRLHDAIIFTAHNHGLPAYREEFRSGSVDVKMGTFGPGKYDEEFFRRGIEKIKKSIQDGSLVMVSVLPGLSAGKSFHKILIIGFREQGNELQGFYYHDSDAKDEPKNNQYIDLATFTTFWRRMAIFLG